MKITLLVGCIVAGASAQYNPYTQAGLYGRPTQAGFYPGLYGAPAEAPVPTPPRQGLFGNGRRVRPEARLPVTNKYMNQMELLMPFLLESQGKLPTADDKFISRSNLQTMAYGGGRGVTAGIYQPHFNTWEIEVPGEDGSPPTMKNYGLGQLPTYNKYLSDMDANSYSDYDGLFDDGLSINMLMSQGLVDNQMNAYLPQLMSRRKRNDPLVWSNTGPLQLHNYLGRNGDDLVGRMQHYYYDDSEYEFNGNPFSASLMTGMFGEQLVNPGYLPMMGAYSGGSFF